MPELRLDIGVIVARKALGGRWTGDAWVPHAVLSAAPPIAPWTPLGVDGLFYAGSSELTLHSSAAAHYRDNLFGGRPSLWVALRVRDGDCAVASVTADPYEGEALTEGLDSLVEAVEMPEVLRAAVGDFVARYHVERPFFKRARERADIDALGFSPGGREDE